MVFLVLERAGSDLEKLRISFLCPPKALRSAYYMTAFHDVRVDPYYWYTVDIFGLTGR